MLFSKAKPQTQSQRIFNAIKHSRHINGVSNWELSRIALNYTMRISELRVDGYNIMAVREYLPNGRATNTFRYHLIEEEN